MIESILLHKLTKHIYVVFFIGANDVARNETMNCISALFETLTKLKHTNGLVMGIPHRHDLIGFSFVKKEVQVVNRKIRKFSSVF